MIQDLLKDLKSETSGSFRAVIEALMVPKELYGAFCLRGAMAVSSCNNIIFFTFYSPFVL